MGTALHRCWAAAVIAVMPAQASTTDPAALVRLAGSVLRIEAPTVRGTLAVGTGVTVADQRVVTNCHVTRDARSVFVIRGGVRWRAETQAADVERDLCLLHVPGLVSPPVPMGSAARLAVGQKVSALGYTGGAMIQRSLGEVLALHPHDGSRVVQASAWFSSGASGGGLFDGQGALVGVLTFRLRGGAAHGFAAPVEWVRQMLDEPARMPAAAVAPIDSARSPYWQLPAALQPRFLRAAAMQRDAAWDDLLLLSRHWLDSETDNVEPWRLLGTALEGLDRLDEAREAFSCALRLAPAHAALRSQWLALQDRTVSPAATTRVAAATAACPPQPR